MDRAEVDSRFMLATKASTTSERIVRTERTIRMAVPRSELAGSPLLIPRWRGLLMKPVYPRYQLPVANLTRVVKVRALLMPRSRRATLYFSSELSTSRAPSSVRTFSITGILRA